MARRKPKNEMRVKNGSNKMFVTKGVLIDPFALTVTGLEHDGDDYRDSTGISHEGVS
jgi:hypothetical protein